MGAHKNGISTLTAIPFRHITSGARTSPPWISSSCRTSFTCRAGQLHPGGRAARRRPARAQPQVRQLEVDLRQTLLTRNGRGAALTEAGRRLLDHARGILYQLERAREELDGMRGAPVGPAVIGVPPSVGRNLTVGPRERVQEPVSRRRPWASSRGSRPASSSGWPPGRIDVGMGTTPRLRRPRDGAAASEPLFPIGGAKTRPQGRPGWAPPCRCRRCRDSARSWPRKPHAVRMFVETHPRPSQAARDQRGVGGGRHSRDHRAWWPAAVGTQCCR